MWDSRRAYEYLDKRRRIAGSQGMMDQIYLKPNEAGVFEKGQARERYDQVKSSAARKVDALPEIKAKTAMGAKFKETARFIGLASPQIKKDLGLAELVNVELVELGGYLAFLRNAEFICGPLKKQEDAVIKTVRDYRNEPGLWVNNKDLVRCTLACESQRWLVGIVDSVQFTCSPRYGMQLIKSVETTPASRDNPCGYSGWNFVVLFKGIRIPAEIQVNTFAMMYGKMSQDSYTKAILGSRPAEYVSTQGRMGFPGGLGHLFYEIWRADMAGADGKAAAELGRWYNDLCRMEVAQRQVQAPQCRRKYLEFCANLTTPAAKQKVADHPLDVRWSCVCGSNTCYLPSCT